jgi:hypothetical protein
VKLHAPELKVSSSISAVAEDDSPFSVFSFFEGDDMVEDCHFLDWLQLILISIECGARTTKTWPVDSFAVMPAGAARAADRKRPARC